MKCREIARLQDFAPNTCTQGLLGALSGPQIPCRIERTPLWKFLSTGLWSTWTLIFGSGVAVEVDLLSLATLWIDIETNKAVKP